jgi:3-deoxy-7-phosphoheptulonate synthase
VDVKDLKLLARKPGDPPREIKAGPVTFGGESVVLIAGPCAVETREQTLAAARFVREKGARMLRGDAYKARSSPHTFQGLGEEGLKLLQEAGRATGLPSVTEVMTPEDVPLVGRYADVFKVGARNFQNFALLRALGGQPKPVLLKRGLAGTLEEWLLSAEHIAAAGNPNVILCERGIRTFERATRNTFDASIIALAKRLSGLPVVADPSHATGSKELVEPVALAAVAAGADAVMVDVHPEPAKALCDAAQALTFQDFEALVPKLDRVARAVGRKLL